MSVPSLLDSSNGVAAADNGDGALGCALGQRLGNIVGALGERLHLENSHGTYAQSRRWFTALKV